MLVLGGVHRTAECIGHCPQLGLIAGCGSAVRVCVFECRLCLLSSRHALSLLFLYAIKDNHFRFSYSADV